MKHVAFVVNAIIVVGITALLVFVNAVATSHVREWQQKLRERKKREGRQ